MNGRIIMSNELGKDTEMFVFYSETLSKDFPGNNEENHKSPKSGQLVSCRNLNS
jgi:hypothetical protein